MMQYIEYLWESGDGISQASYTLAAGQHYINNLRHQLYGSWRLVSAWRKLELPEQARAITLEMVLAIAGVMSKLSVQR